MPPPGIGPEPPADLGPTDTGSDATADVIEPDLAEPPPASPGCGLAPSHPIGGAAVTIDGGLMPTGSAASI